MIGDNLGQEIAKRVAQELVVYHRRPGGQSQFSVPLELDAENERFAAPLAWARENVGKDLTVERRANASSVAAIRLSVSRARRDSATLNACAALSCALSASRHRAFGAWRATNNDQPKDYIAYYGE